MLVFVIVFVGDWYLAIFCCDGVVVDVRLFSGLVLLDL